MRRATAQITFVASCLALLAACSPGESADNPPGSAVEGSAATTPAVSAASTSYTLAVGTRFEAELVEEISSRHAHAGDTFTARVAEDVRSPSEWVAIPAGATVHGTITEVSPADDSTSTGTLTIEVSSVTVAGSLYDLDASIDALGTVKEGRDDMDIVLPAGSRVTLTLRQPLSLMPRR